MPDVIKKKSDAGTGTPTTKKIEHPAVIPTTTNPLNEGLSTIVSNKPKTVVTTKPPVVQTPAEIARQKSVDTRLNATSGGSTKPPVIVQTPPIITPQTSGVKPEIIKPGDLAKYGPSDAGTGTPGYTQGDPETPTLERIDSPTVDMNGAPVEEEKVPASGQPGYGETGSGSTTKTTTGSGSSTTTTGTGTTTTTTGGTTTPETPTGTNPYYDQLKTMTFEYDPFSDPDYLETAAALENQVAQMMVGRGGLYSSVTQAAFQSRLITLQNDMRQQKFDEWTEERDFIFKLAQFEEDKQNTKFEQDLALAEFNLRKQESAFEQSMALAAQRQAASNSAYNKQNSDAQTSVSNKKQTVVSQAQQYESMKRTFDYYYAQWKKTGVADSRVASYFGVAPGTSINKAGYAITSKSAYISAYKDYVLENAKTVDMDERLLEDVGSYYDNRYTPPKKSPKGPAKRETM